MKANVEKNPTPLDLEAYKFEVLTKLEATERRALHIAESTRKIVNRRMNLLPIDDPYFSSPEAAERRRILLELINGGTSIPEALKIVDKQNSPDQL